MQYADDGFGNLIPTQPQPPEEKFTSVFFRSAGSTGKMQRWRIDTGDHELAIKTVRDETKIGIRPILAMIEGGRKCP